MATGLDGDLDELLTLPPAQFVRARNALADRLRQAGRKEQAAEVKRLPRPSPTVWAINRTAREAPKAVAEMVDAVARLEQAQAGHSGDLHEAIERERRARGRVLQLALARLAERGHASAETVRRLSSTLLGAAGDRSARADLTRGRLTEDRHATGFDLLAATPIHRAADGRRRDEQVPAAARRTPAKVAKLPVRPLVDDDRRRREEERRTREAARRADVQARARGRRAAALAREAARHRRSAQKAEREATELRARLQRVEQRGADAARAASKAAEAARRVRDET